MSNPISEEQTTQQPGGAVDKVRKAARQLAYDVRYKVKGQFKDGQKSDAASLKRAYMQQLGKSPAPGPVKVMAKKMLVGEAYDLVDVSDTVNESVVNALLKVFAKKTQLEDADGNVAYEVTDIVQEEMKDTKYKVRVTDKSTGKTYVRMADREKISQLRADPRISSVEMTGYGDSYDKPVGKEKEEKKEVAKESNLPMTSKESQAQKSKMRNYDSSATQEMGRRTKDAYHKIRGVAVAANELRKDIKSLKGNETAKEEFIHEVNVEDDNPDANAKKIDVMKGKNKIIINPTQSEEMKPGEDTSAEKTKESSAEKRIRMVKRKILQSKMQAVRQGAGADVVAHTEYEGEHISEGEECARTPEGVNCPVHGESKCPSAPSTKSKKDDDDYRGMTAKVNMVRNKMRAMGLRMSYDMEGEVVNEEDSDRMKDRRMERGGVGGNIDYSRPPAAPNLAGKKKPKSGGPSAIDFVKAQIRAKHGKGAIMDTKKK